MKKAVNCLIVSLFPVATKIVVNLTTQNLTQNISSSRLMCEMQEYIERMSEMCKYLLHICKSHTQCVRDGSYVILS